MNVEDTRNGRITEFDSVEKAEIFARMMNDFIKRNAKLAPAFVLTDRTERWNPFE